MRATLILLLTFYTVSSYSSGLSLESLMAQGKTKEAIQLAEKQYKKDRRNIDLLKKIITWSGWVSLTKKRLQYMEVLAKKDPSNEKLLFDLAQGLQWDQQFKKSIVYYKKVLKLNSENNTALKNIGLAYISVKDIPAFLESATDYLALEPNDTEVLYLQAQHCHWNTCWQRSLANYDKILTLEPSHSNALKYKDLLSYEKSGQTFNEYKYYVDSTDLTQNQITNDYSNYLNSKLKYKLEHQTTLQEDKVRDFSNHLLKSTLSWSHTSQSISHAHIGVNLPNSIPHYGYVFNTSLFTKNYVSLKVMNDSYHPTTEAHLNEISALNMSASVYSEQFKDHIISGEITQQLISDENTNFYYSLFWKYYAFDQPKRIYSTFNLIQQKFKTIYDGASPYFTEDTRPLYTLGAGVEWFKTDKYILDTQFKLAIREDDSVNFQPDVYFSYVINRAAKLQMRYVSSGSEVYNYNLFSINLTYKFL